MSCTLLNTDQFLSVYKKRVYKANSNKITWTAEIKLQINNTSFALLQILNFDEYIKINKIILYYIF